MGSGPAHFENSRPKTSILQNAVEVKLIQLLWRKHPNAWSWIERRAERIIRKESLPISSMTSSGCSLNRDSGGLGRFKILNRSVVVKLRKK
ncbi:MAG: hypothetical protein CL915_00670 [Deltaproteobacteria bacterium]|nr:hypothetical protein [Deltaproteobacteria bacterium]